MLSLALSALLAAGAYATSVQPHYADHGHGEGPAPRPSDVYDGGMGHGHHGAKVCATQKVSVLDVFGKEVVHPSMDLTSNGSFFLFRDQMYDYKHGKKGKQLGDIYGTCGVFDYSKGIYYCSYTFRFMKGEKVIGTISLEGPTFDVKKGSSYPLAVTGGTGHYFGAKGVDNVTPVVAGAKVGHEIEFTSCTPKYGHGGYEYGKGEGEDN